MDELIKQIVAKTGMSEDMARTAAQTVIAFLKERLPAPIAGQIDAVLSGGSPNLGDAGKSLGGLFGR